MPRRSSSFRIALNAPDIANAQVPTRSKTKNRVSWVTVGNGGRLRRRLHVHDLHDLPLRSPYHHVATGRIPDSPAGSPRENTMDMQCIVILVRNRTGIKNSLRGDRGCIMTARS